MVFPTNVKDKDIKSLLKSVNCNVRKIQHGDMAIHVWFWAKDNIALKSALDLAYKLKGRLTPETPELLATVNINLTGGETNKAIKRIKIKKGK